MKPRKLGSQGFTVSALGLGCMGMSEFYGSSNDAQSKKVLLAALEKGITFLDTADTYGNGHNEELIEGVLKEWTGQVCIATKFGIVRKPGVYEREICGRPEYVREAAEKSLKRLNRDVIDLYYYHRLDPRVPIEETVGAMSDLVAEGKVLYLGLSEVSAETLLRAHRVHPVTCVQSEYSLVTRQIESTLLPVLKEHGIGLVPYSPLGRGLITGKLTPEMMKDEKDFRKFLPRTSEAHYSHNMALVSQLKTIADKKAITRSSIALAWLLSKGENIVPIPGTRNIRYLADNISSTSVILEKEEIEQIEAIFHPNAVKGERYTKEGMKGIDE